MKKYNSKAMELIAASFEKHHAHFHVFNKESHEELWAGFSVNCGPNVIMRFIVRDNSNDVSARIIGLIAQIPEKKRPRALEACNILNCKMRFLKFCLDGDGDVNVEYDFPVNASDDDIGEMTFEVFVRAMSILNNEYDIFMKALYTDSDLDEHDGFDLHEELKKQISRLRRQLESHSESHIWGVDDDDDDDDDDDEINLAIDALEDRGDHADNESEESFADFLKRFAHEEESALPSDTEETA